MTKSGKHGGKWRNCTFCAISSFVTMFSKKPSAAEASESVYMRERVKKCILYYIYIVLECTSFFNSVQGPYNRTVARKQTIFPIGSGWFICLEDINLVIRIDYCIRGNTLIRMLTLSDLQMLVLSLCSRRLPKTHCPNRRNHS